MFRKGGKMLEIKVTTIKKAKTSIQDERTRSRKRKRKSPIMEEYEEYLKKLERGKAIAFALKEGDKYQTIKYRLNNAAESLGVKNLKIERAGNKVIFYKEARPHTRKVVQHRGDVWPVQDESREEQSLYDSEYEAEPKSELAPPDAPTIQTLCWCRGKHGLNGRCVWRCKFRFRFRLIFGIV